MMDKYTSYQYDGQLCPIPSQELDSAPNLANRIRCATVDFAGGLHNELTINVITSTNKLLFGHAADVVNILFTKEDSEWKSKISKVSVISDLVDATSIDDSIKKKVIQGFLSCPPPFVDQKLGIPIDEYIKFITQIVKETKKCISSGTDETSGKDEKTKVLEAIGESFVCLKTGIKNIKANFNENVLVDGKHTTYKTAITKQFKSFVATLMYCLQYDDALVGPDPTIDLQRWPGCIIQQGLDIKEIQNLDQDEFNAKSVISLLEKRNQPREKDRLDALKLLTEHLTQLSISETSKITDADKKEQFSKTGTPVASEFIKQCFKHDLKHSQMSGIATVKSLLKTQHDTTEFSEILEYVWREASKQPAVIDITDAVQPQIDIPVKPVDPTYETRLVEPPAFSVKFRFQPPIYDVNRNWLNFVEFKAIPYFMTHRLSYKDRAAALWHCLPNVNLRNRYMLTFGPYITGNLIENNSDFATLYRKVGDYFWPEQTLLPHDHEKSLSKPSFIRQKNTETYGDFVTRLKTTFKLAYPSSHDSDTNKLKLSEMVFKGIQDRWLKNILFKDHYDLVFVTGEVNKMLEVMDREKLKSHKAKQLAAEGLSLNYIQHKPNFNQHQKPKELNFKRNQNFTHKPKVVGARFTRNHGSNNRNRDSKNSSNRREDAVRKESTFLVKNKNVNSSGKLIIPLDEIPGHLKNNPQFNPRDYVPKQRYREIIKMAESNVKRRNAAQHKKAANTRKYRRKVDNKNRRTNILIEPRRYVNNVDVCSVKNQTDI